MKQTQGSGVSIVMVVIHRAGSVTTWQNQCTCAQADNDVPHFEMTVLENIVSQFGELKCFSHKREF